MYGIDSAAPEFSVSHEALVDAIARFLRPGLYVELGSQCGHTFRLAAVHAQQAIAVDIQPLGHHVAGVPNARFVQQSAVEFLRALPDNAIDLCFLDASHDYEATLAEFESLSAKIRPNGVALLHDTYPPNERFLSPDYCGRACDAVPVLQRRFAGVFEFATLPAQFGLTIARKNMGQQVLWRPSRG